MKTLIATIIAASLGLAYPAIAEDAHHPDQPLAQAQGAATTKPAAKPEETVKKMQDNVKKMPGQLERVAKARTDEERQKAMAEHVRTMQENMQMARGMQAGMMGCPMMEGGMGGMMGMMGGGMMGQGGMGMMGGPGAGPGAGAERMQQMERRMDMMQMMMEQMLRRPEGMPAAPAK
ncbi:MAG: hypothetical protein HY778_02580 [Betaproteobacteria bacterium]|nr:hypothetical protein [Betaproteobacteria bacterium]